MVDLVSSKLIGEFAGPLCCTQKLAGSGLASAYQGSRPASAAGVAAIGEAEGYEPDVDLHHSAGLAEPPASDDADF